MVNIENCILQHMLLLLFADVILNASGKLKSYQNWPEPENFRKDLEF